VSGVPNTGKSEWIDALAVNLAENHGWPIAFCSFEKVPRHHAGQLLEKVTGLSFFKVHSHPRLLEALQLLMRLNSVVIVVIVKEAGL
jgi:twinkle protein